LGFGDPHCNPFALALAMIEVSVTPRRLTEQEWADVRLEYETSAERPTLRELADKHQISRSTIFKRAAREKWKQNAILVEATRKQIVKKMEANLEAATSEAAQLVAKQVVEDLHPWIQREKEEHIRRAVGMGKRGFERIGKLWDAEEPVDPKARESRRLKFG
jgi:DNA-binding transcriptional regulator YhcF (GntR family)